MCCSAPHIPSQFDQLNFYVEKICRNKYYNFLESGSFFPRRNIIKMEWQVCVSYDHHVADTWLLTASTHHCSSIRVSGFCKIIAQRFYPDLTRLCLSTCEALYNRRAEENKWKIRLPIDPAAWGKQQSRRPVKDKPDNSFQSIHL